MSATSSYPSGSYPPGTPPGSGYGGYPAQPQPQAHLAQPGQPPAQGYPGQPPAQGYPGQQPAQSARPGTLEDQAGLLRRAPTGARVAGWVVLVLGAALALLGVGLLPAGEPEGGAFCLGVGVLLLVVGPIPLRQRTVFDADGIHSRRFLSETHLSWPGSRGAFVVDVSMAGRYSKVATVEVTTPVGTTRLACPRATSGNDEAARMAVEDDLDVIWAWATARGYARETVLGQQLAGGATAYGNGAAPGGGGAQPGYPGAPTYAGSPYAPGSPVTAAGQPRAVPGLSAPGGAAPAPVSGTGDGAPRRPLVVDQALLSQEPLVLRGWPGRRGEVLAYSALGLAIAALGAFMLVSGSGGQKVLSGAVLLAGGAGLLWASYTIAASTLTVSREGLAFFNGLRTRRLPWPTSRSSVFVTAPRSQRRTIAMVHVLAPDGKDVRVPGLGLSARKEADALHPATQVAETIWMWGASRGVARDDGGYLPAASAETEQRRLAAARRIAYLLSGPGAAG